MTDINTNYCPQCPNHCPETALKCGRGRSYFGQEQEGNQEHGRRENCGHEHSRGQEYGCERGEGHEHGRRENCGHGRGENCGHGRGENCGRGRRGERGEGHGRGASGTRDDLYGRMRACGHYLYHRSGRGAGQGKILAILSERESMTQKELQEILQIQPGSMSELLAKLEEKGLILRRKDEEDKRRSILTLTEAGQTVAKEQQREEKPLFEALDETEQEELKNLLGKLLDSWK